ncbi:MAG: lipid A deacylase LpxR family protein [Chitinophagaceae bacterium]|nr:lipid A deacylase LpxR family protein [Chitinophagaceae bacterium]
MKFLKLPTLLVFFCLHHQLSAQNGSSDVSRANEISFTTENDAYLLQFKDAYYTNGLFLKYTRASTKNNLKRLHSIELGQMIYTPLNRFVNSLSLIDRPYSGLLFLQYQQTDFLNKEALMQWSVKAGVIGEASGAENVQNWFHSIFAYGKFAGWQYQVQNALIINAGLKYAQTVYEMPGHFKIVPQGLANLGNGFINAGAGSYLCWGVFEKNQNSSLWNAGVSNTSSKPKREFFLFALPELYFEAYNATIQGALFSHNDTAVLSETRPLFFQQTIGGCFSYRQFSTKLQWVFQSKESVNQIRTQQYLSFQFNYRF